MIRVLLLLMVLAGTALAQEPAPHADAPPADDSQPIDLTPTKIDDAACLPLDLTPGALLQPAQPTGPNSLATPIAWSEFDVQGKLIDKPEVVRALLAPTLNQFRTSLSTATLPMVAQMTARFGYQLIGHVTQDEPDGAKLILSLAPLPLVRKVDVDVKDQPLFAKVLDDEVKRRMSIRRGSYLPWAPLHRQCALREEERRVNEYLFDQGYFDAAAKIYYVPHALGSADIRAVITLQPNKGRKQLYDVGKVTVNCPPGSERRNNRCYDAATGALVELPISESTIRKTFTHTRSCLILGFCWGGGFSRDQYQQDVKTVRELFQRRGFPSVHVQASDPRTTLNRDNQTVNPVITIDPRRRVDVEFVGYDTSAIQESALREKLTFDVAGSADDVEAADSAQKLTTYLQERGYFDAHVTWSREHVDEEPRPGSNDVGLHFDRVRFQLDTGHIRRVTSVQFVGNSAISSDTLGGLIATKVANLGGSLFGTSAAATSPELILDQERIKEEYRRAGYPNARVWPSASVSGAGLDNAAMTAALIGVDDTSDLYVRFTIEEGEPTLLTRVVVTAPNDKPLDDALCADILSELAGELGDRDVARRGDKDQCATTIAGLKFRYDDVAATRDRLREFLLKAGRARAEVDYAAVPFGVNRVEARYTIKDPERLKIGKIVIRGATRTNETIIRDEVSLKEGDVLTTDHLAEGARRLRNMGLFEAVNIEMPDLECEKQERTCNSDVINAVIRVEERYVYRAEVGVEGGNSSLNGLFGTLRWTQGNLFGRGILFRFSGTYGTKLRELEGTLRLPQWWLARQVFGIRREYAFTTDLTGLYRQQDTERFGRLTTKGVTLGVSRQWPRQRTETTVARSLGLGLQYDFRVRLRNVDALRPIGADMDQSQVAISTRTGAIRLNWEWEQRVDRNGQLSPLAPEAGHRIELSAAYASPYLAGQNTFVKLSAYAAKFFPIGKNMVLRFDGRYDQGIPLGQGEILLPDVERFFAGGDSTVRGYAEDRLKTEIIQVGVPPLDNVSQIRVIPVGGNIRTLGSIDAQVRIWKLLAGAMFADAGLITNNWRVVDVNDIRPSVGMGLRALTPFGIGALEYAIPIRPQLGDDPRGRIHFYFAARAQF